MKRSITAVSATLALTSFAHAYAASGTASYYGGRGRTASGGHVGHMTAAHKTLPFGTQLRVTNLRNHLSAVVTVNDRGPFIRGRIVDVSVGAAHALGMHASGTAPVHIEVVGSGTRLASTEPMAPVAAEVAPVTAAVAVPVAAPAAAKVPTPATNPTLAHDPAGNAANPFTTLFTPATQTVEAAPVPVKARRHHRRGSTGLS